MKADLFSGPCFRLCWVCLQEWTCGVMGYCSEELTGVFPAAHNAEFLFVCLLAVCICCLEKCPLP